MIKDVDFPGILLSAKPEQLIKATRQYLIPFNENFQIENTVEDEIYKKILDLRNDILKKYETAFPEKKIDIGYLTITVTDT